MGNHKAQRRYWNSMINKLTSADNGNINDDTYGTVHCQNINEKCHIITRVASTRLEEHNFCPSNYMANCL